MYQSENIMNIEMTGTFPSRGGVAKIQRIFDGVVNYKTQIIAKKKEASTNAS
jgi:hypothetical protein